MSVSHELSAAGFRARPKHTSQSAKTFRFGASEDYTITSLLLPGVYVPTVFAVQY